MRIPAGAGRRFAATAIRRLVPWLFCYLSPLLMLILLFFFVYAVLFLIPKYIVRDIETQGSNLCGRVVAIFTTGDRDDWKQADDQKLYGKYMDLDRSWLNRFMDQEELDNSRVHHHEGNAAREEATVKEVWGRFYEKDSGIPAERSQVKQHSVSWALLAAVDRVLGDPVITGLPGRRPNPEEHFRKLEPKLKWRDFELYYRRSWTERSGKDGNGGAEKKTIIYRHRIRLLTEVESYEAEKITYHWETKRHYRRDPGSGSTEEAVYPVFTGLKQQGPYFKRLRSLLAEHQLVKDSDLELVINLAMNYDEEFKYNISLISGNLTELFQDTENTTYPGADPEGRYHWPTGRYTTVTSGYGWRIHPVLGGLRFHKGIDIAVPGGTPVLAAWDGRVILAGWVEGYGKTVIIDHGRYRTLYAHLMSLEVDPGQEVRLGELIGRADSTGLSTGNHLHFEIRSGAGETDYHDPLALYGAMPGREAENP
ncbi:MAG: M23 family metallopeptidase [Peptococcaceae bacterium]|nr:M23 family metallopeptidase [Peptococcaceae bacterium]